jgi:MFS family permease
MPRNRGYHLHLPSLHFNKSRNANMLYGVRVFRDLVSKLAIFFLPIYLYQHGSSDPFWQFLPGNELQKGVLVLVLFYLVHRATILLTGIEIGRLITRIGYRKSMLTGFILFAIFLSLLYVKENPGWMLLLASFVNGLETNFFWNSYNTLISKFTLKRHMGQDLGLLNFLLQLGQAIAPALGGLLIVSFGFRSLFLVGIVGILICIIFVLQLQIKRERDVISWKEFSTWTREKSFLRLATSQAGRYFNDATLIFWPLYIFLILGAIDRVGFLYTLSLFMAMIVSFGVGFYIDNNKNKKPFYVSGGVLSILWILRSQVISFWQIAIIDTLDKLSANFYAVYYDAIAIKRGKGSQALSYFVYRELIVSIMAIPFWTMVGGLFLIFPEPWLALFMLAAVGVLMGLLVKEHHSS